MRALRLAFAAAILLVTCAAGVPALKYGQPINTKGYQISDTTIVDGSRNATFSALVTTATTSLGYLQVNSTLAGTGTQNAAYITAGTSATAAGGLMIASTYDTGTATVNNRRVSVQSQDKDGNYRDLQLQPNGQGVYIGSATGGGKGNGTLNVAGNQYVNGSLYIDSNRKLWVPISLTGTMIDLGSGSAAGAISADVSTVLAIHTKGGAGHGYELACYNTQLLANPSGAWTQTIGATPYKAISGTGGGSSTVNTASFESEVTFTGATIGSGYHFYAGAPTQTGGSGAITTAYGLYVAKQKQTGVTTGYGVYVADSGDKNYMAGGLNPNTDTATDSATINNYYTGSFAATMTGFASNLTNQTIYYTRVGKLVTLSAGAMSSTSNSAACTITGLPTWLLPAHTVYHATPTKDNGTVAMGYCDIATSGTITLGKTLDTGGGFTTSGAKGVPYLNITYTMQ